MKTVFSSTILVTLLSGIPVLHGAVLINSVGTFGYSQNFDGFDVFDDVTKAGTAAPLLWDGQATLTSSTTAWQNDSTYAGWTRQVAIGATTNRTDKDYIGEFTGGTIRFGNMGSSTLTPADRAVGVLMQGLVGVGNSASFGVVFGVGSGLDVTSATVGYNGEQWFRALTSNGIDRMDFQYKILSSYNPAEFLINSETGWTDFNNLDFTALVTGETTSKLNGNAALNRTPLSDTISLSATEGEFIAFRWNYISDNLAAQAGLAVDDLVISFTTVAIPEPSSALLALLGATFLLRRSRP